jgi:hypothetical protein
MGIETPSTHEEPDRFAESVQYLIALAGLVSMAGAVGQRNFGLMAAAVVPSTVGVVQVIRHVAGLRNRRDHPPDQSGTQAVSH